MLFDDWSGIGRVLLVGLLAYAALILMLRISGKRTLSKMNAFDLVVTVAIGSTLATILLSDQVALAEGLTALALLIGLQYVVAWASVRSRRVSATVKSEPRLLYFRGQYLHGALRSERVTISEVEAAMREQGHSSSDAVTAIVLETSGDFAVITGPADGDLFPATTAGKEHPVRARPA